MGNLLKTDLKRIIKDKLFLIICIIGAVMAVFTPLLNKLLADNINIDGEIEFFIVTAKYLFFNSFSATNNFGLLLPIFVTIIIFKDFSHGTIRNKIICGNSRLKIFLSIFLSSFIIIFGVILIQALLSLLISLMFFKYTDATTANSEFLYFLESLMFVIINYVFIAALVSFFCVFMKNSGTAIVCFVAVCILLSSLPLVFEVYVSIIETNESKKGLVDFLNFLIDTNIYNNLAYVIGKGTTYTNQQVMKILFPPVLFSGLFITLSILIFKKKDIK